MTAPRSPTSIPRQSSLQRALSELENKPLSDEENSPRGMPAKKTKSSLQRELVKLKADNFLELYDRQAELRGKTRL
eukprot:CAMPEP_0197262084 /NCGR_PEP_ID=MMETSP1432-20130617/318_1 /TAXON_ID=44447 /ORGANISM="Pseudo-nitzschia delicatissima, Strain UNC1205" /LENGTH=75 /DNA_ID=CAMNT_0042726383 /DNA_START=45 /DNA_END=272 /DNA_ORIENTATION=+